jgi:uncharacterized damage-inducible protein DinB
LRGPDTDLILAELDEVYRGPAWHGPAVLEALDGVDSALAATQVAPGRNSIWDLVLHLAHGRHILIERLRHTTFEFPRSVREPWWPHASVETGEAAWRRDLALLDEYHEMLVQAVRSASPQQLARVPDGAEHSVARQLLGMVHHDAYHAGQIRILALVAKGEGEGA